MGLLDKAWSAFVEKVQRMAHYPVRREVASSFLEGVLTQNDAKRLSGKALREHEAIVALIDSAPGQELSSTKGTLWGVMNAVTYYVDHVRSGNKGERLDSAWFVAGYAVKEKAWARASLLVSP
jgi:hypothetical protein